MALQANKPDREYNCTQAELYAICKIALTSFLENIADFSNFKGYYNNTWATQFEQEITNTQQLPALQQRGELSEIAHIQLKEKGDQCLIAWQRLKRHIIDAYPSTLHKPKLEAAGQKRYKKAANSNWKILQELMVEAESFITKNLTELSANQNMPPTFQTKVTTLKNEFNTLYNTFTDAVQDAEEETTEKIIANNKIFNKLMKMFNDGQEIFRTNRAKRERFIFTKVLEIVNHSSQNNSIDEEV